jgi:hypothetical protein
LYHTEEEDCYKFDLKSYRDLNEDSLGVRREARIDSDGFADFKIFIKALMCEIKILLLPIYLKIKEDMN